MARPGGQGAPHKNKYLDPEQMKRPPDLCLDSVPLFQNNSLDDGPNILVPIFPRSRIARSGYRPSNVSNSRIENLSDLPHKIFPPAPVQDLNTCQENLVVVVDGWRIFFYLFLLTFLFISETLQSSPTLTTPTSSQENQIDQLFEFSSPNTDLSPIKLLKDSKMGGYLVGCLLRDVNFPFFNRRCSHPPISADSRTKIR